MCSCDFDKPDIFESIQRKARKHHKCSECGWTILPHSTYWEISGLWEGKWGHYKQCLHCQQISDRLVEAGCCYGLGELYEELQDSGILIFDEESEQWESTEDWLRIVSQNQLHCIALEVGGEWVDLEVAS
jgi:hypothetical protein